MASCRLAAGLYPFVRPSGCLSVSRLCLKLLPPPLFDAVAAVAYYCCHLSVCLLSLAACSLCGCVRAFSGLARVAVVHRRCCCHSGCCFCLSPCVMGGWRLRMRFWPGCTCASHAAIQGPACRHGQGRDPRQNSAYADFSIRGRACQCYAVDSGRRLPMSLGVAIAFQNCARPKRCGEGLAKRGPTGKGTNSGQLQRRYCQWMKKEKRRTVAAAATGKQQRSTNGMTHGRQNEKIGARETIGKGDWTTASAAAAAPNSNTATASTDALLSTPHCTLH